MIGIVGTGGEGGIRTLGTGVSPYNGLANRRIRPLCHLSGPNELHHSRNVRLGRKQSHVAGINVADNPLERLNQ